MELKVNVKNYGERVFNTQDLGDIKTTGQQCVVGEINEIKLSKITWETRLRFEKFKKLRDDYLDDNDSVNPKVLEYYNDSCTITENKLKRLESIAEKCSSGNTTVYAKNHMLVKDCIGLDENQELLASRLVKYRKDDKYQHVYSIKLIGTEAIEYIDKVIREELKARGFGSALDSALVEKGVNTTFELATRLTFMYRDFKDGIAPVHTFKGKTIDDCKVSNLEYLKLDLAEYNKIIEESVLDKDGVKFLKPDCGNGLSTDLIYNINVVVKTVKTGIFKALLSKLGVYPLYFIDGKLVVASVTELRNLNHDIEIYMGEKVNVFKKLKVKLEEIK